MPRILKKLTVFLLTLLLFEWIVTALFPIVLIMIINVVLFLLLVLNQAVVNRILAQKAPFSTSSRIRNVDCLIIGAPCEYKHILPQDCNTFVHISSMDMSIKSCFEILKHTSSILKENGGCVIFVPQIHENGKFSLFDAFFFNDVTLVKHNMKSFKLKKFFPLLFAPIMSTKLLSKRKVNFLNHIDCPDIEIYRFCLERNLKLCLFAGIY